MKEAVLVIIKPDGMTRGLMGAVLTKFAQTGLDIAALSVKKPHQDIVEKHYSHLKDKPFFNGVVDYLLGKYHKKKKVLAIIYYGEEAIKKCRKITGATNPEEADPMSIRGAYGRITTQGIYENVVHVSSDKKEAQREIKLWFDPDEIETKLFPTKQVTINTYKKRVWQ